MPRYKNQYTRGNSSVSQVVYNEIEREDNVVLYKGTPISREKEKESQEENIQYEIHVLKYEKASPYGPDAGNTVLMSPTSSKWGSLGFTYNTYEGAKQRYDDLVASNPQKARFLELRDLIEAPHAELGKPAATMDKVLSAILRITPYSPFR